MSYTYCDYPPRSPSYPAFTPMWPPAANPPIPSEIRIHPSLAETMGVDPISKLAAAVDRLAAALEGKSDET